MNSRPRVQPTPSTAVHLSFLESLNCVECARDRDNVFLSYRYTNAGRDLSGRIEALSRSSFLNPLPIIPWLFPFIPRERTLAKYLSREQERSRELTERRLRPAKREHDRSITPHREYAECASASFAASMRKLRCF